MALNWKSGRLEAGKLRHRIDIVKVSPVQDSTGGINLSEDVIFAQVWASVEAVSGAEQPAAGSENSVTTHQVIIRYIAGAPDYQIGVPYAAGQLVKDPAGYLQQCMTPGGTAVIADSSTWSDVEGVFTEDGDPSIETFLWLNRGVAPLYEGVDAAMQVWFKGRQLQITSVLNPDEKNKMLCLNCTEINSSKQQKTNQPSGLA
jgi:head-tail adaptor